VRRSITISSFKRLPGGLLIAAALILLVESVIYSSRPELVTDFWNKFLINEHVLVDVPGDYDYLIIGDSIQKTSINPTLVSDSLLNLGLPGGKPMGLYLLFKRYLEKHKAPKAVFLYVDPEDAKDSLFVILRYFVNVPEFMSIWKDLTWKERQVFLMRYWVSLDTRKVARIAKDNYPYPNSYFVKNMLKNRGYVPLLWAGTSIDDDLFRKTTDRVTDKVSFSRIDLKYLDKFMELARHRNIKVVFLGFFTPVELLAFLEKTGFNNDYKKFLVGLAKRYPDAYFEDNPISYMENRYFCDPSHLNNEGSKIFTEYFKNGIFKSCESLVEKK
jgi:hypothetical protein